MGPWDDNDSLPALSLEAAAPSAEHPFARPEAERYRTEHVLGWGGMGRVTLAADQRLGRDVAIKRAAPGNRSAEARLAQEAWITARLEHPGIVPVYDAGCGPDGRPWYAMRLVRGRPLAEALADPSVDRQRLVRHFLAACEAVGYAHHRGVIHRDLKPGNILIGEFGETQVADWGLARPLAPNTLPAQIETIEGNIMGTPAYMSPEQAAGQPTDARSDVWSLGATLYEVLSGKPPFSGESDAILRQLAAQTPPTLDGTELPAELVAVVSRAMAPSPSKRYADAREMAADVERWLTGARVQAHRYTSAELLTRFVLARRAALAVAGIAAVALLLAALWLLQERQRAISAEQRAEQARAVAAENLAQALLSQAIQAQRDGAQPEAEHLAAEVLRIVPDSPGARSILAAFSGVPSPRLASVHPLPGCDSAALSPDGTLYACHRQRTLTLSAREQADFTARWSKPLDNNIVAFSHPERLVAYSLTGQLWLLDATDGTPLLRETNEGLTHPMPSGPGEIIWWQGSNTVRLTTQPRTAPFKWTRRIAALLRHPDGALILIDDAGGVYRRSDDGADTFITQTALIGEHLAKRMHLQGDTLVIGGLRGQAALVDLAAGRTTLQVRGQGGNVTDAQLSPDGTLLATAGTRGTIELFRVDTGARVMVLPGEHVWALRFSPDGRYLETFGEDLRRWQLPEAHRPLSWKTDDGITTVDLSADGSLVAASTGAGTVQVWDAHTGALRRTFPLSRYVTKAISFAPTGTQLAITHAQPSGIVLGDVDTGALSPHPLDSGKSCRRLAWVPDLLVATTYSIGPLVIDERAGEVRDDLHQLNTVMVDLARAPDHGALALSDTDGGIWRMDTRPPALARLAEAPDASQVAIDDRPARRIAIGGADTLEIRDGQTGAVLRSLSPPGQRMFDLAFSPGGGLLAAGLLDGSVMIWDTDEGGVLGVLRGHEQQVASLRFTDDGSGLLSASWDGTVRLWGMGALSASADTLIAETTERWGLQLDDILPR